MTKFTHVLKNRNFFFLWLGQIISQVGDRLSQMALIGLIYLKAPGSTIQIAKTLSFTLIPVFLIGPLAGAYVDRWNRRQTMYACDFLRTVLILLIPLFLFDVQNFIWIYLIVFLAFSIGRFFVPAKLAIIPELVDKEDLLLANSLVNTTGMIAAVLGFGISGIIVERWGAEKGFYLDALSFFISGLLIFLIRKKDGGRIDIRKFGREIMGAIGKSIGTEIKEGILYFIKEKDIRFTAWIMFALFSALGSIYVVSIVFIQKTLHSATKDLGLIIMFLGVGLFLGSLFYGRFGQRLSQYKVIFTSLIFSGLMLVIFALVLTRYPFFAVAALLSLFLGLVIAPIMIASNTIVHQVSANHMLGKIFSSLEIVMHLGFLSFMFISSALAERFAHEFILITVGVIVAILGLANLVIHHKIPWLD
jgi:DHA3 family macrolide efflux protein-like MFS transporter